MSSDVIALSRITYMKMMLNVVWATPCNVITIPAAAGRALSTSFHFNVIDNGTVTQPRVQWVRRAR